MTKYDKSDEKCEMSYSYQSLNGMEIIRGNRIKAMTSPFYFQIRFFVVILGVQKLKSLLINKTSYIEQSPMSSGLYKLI